MISHDLDGQLSLKHEINYSPNCSHNTAMVSPSCWKQMLFRSRASISGNK